jgi:hypothetical protein
MKFIPVFIRLAAIGCLVLAAYFAYKNTVHDQQLWHVFLCVGLALYLASTDPAKENS